MSDPGTPRSGRDPHANGYPTLFLRLLTGVYRYEDVPKNLTDEKELIEFGEHRCASSGFSTCMVLGPRDAWYCDPGGSPTHTEKPPSKGVMLENGRLVRVENESVNAVVNEYMEIWDQRKEGR